MTLVYEWNWSINYQIWLLEQMTILLVSVLVRDKYDYYDLSIYIKGKILNTSVTLVPLF